MKRFAGMLLCLACLFGAAFGEETSKETVLEPLWPIPNHVTWLLEVASGEVGYEEGPHGYSKYGEWAGDPYAQWCAEFLDWCVDQVDQLHGTQLLDTVYPLYSGSNGGRGWYIRQGRYLVRNGHLEDWGYQWLKGTDHYLKTGDYIPQPGDWVFFTWTSDTDTDHVALVEYCTQNEEGDVTIHVIEGNNPSGVARGVYDLKYSRILGYGTVHDAANWSMRSGNKGAKVLELQEKLIYLGYLPEDAATGTFGAKTRDAVIAFQQSHDISATGVAAIATQTALEKEYDQAIAQDAGLWQVVDDEE